MDYNALRIFVVCAQKGSFSAAAKHLGMPLPTVSRKMAELERDLTTQLFDRSTRGCVVTAAGARLWEKIGASVEVLNDLEHIGQLDSAQLSGRLRLSMPQSFWPWWELLGEFQRLHPDIEVSVYSTERRVDLLSDGMDVALRVGAISDDSVVARHLCDFRLILVASPQLAAQTLNLSVEEIGSLPCASWGNTCNDQPVWRLGSATIPVNARLIVNDYLHLRERALAGDFITELPSFLAAKDISEGRLVEVFPRHPLPYTPLHLIYRRFRYPSAVIRTYLDFCSENFSRFFPAHSQLPRFNRSAR